MGTPKRRRAMRRASLVVALLFASAVSGDPANTTTEGSSSGSASDDDAAQEEQRWLRERLERDASIPSLNEPPKVPLKDVLEDVQSTGGNSSRGSFRSMQGFMEKRLKLKMPSSGAVEANRKGRCVYNEYQPWPCDRFPCNDHGFLVKGACYCEEPWFGASCELQGCNQQCNHFGVCVNGTCACDKQYAGPTCGECSPGLVDFPNCTLPKIADATCPGDCTGPSHGQCVDGKCVCKEGWFGESCSKMQPGTCKNNCNNKGKCVLGVCECDDQYYGQSCEFDKCHSAAECSNHGLCREGKCICEPKYFGHTCDKLRCPANTMSQSECTSQVNGHCDRDTGRCVCHKGFAGVDCSMTACPFNCSFHGICNQGLCKCIDGYSGEDCGLRPGMTAKDKILKDKMNVDACKQRCDKGCQKECASEDLGSSCGQDCLKRCDLDCTVMRSAENTTEVEERVVPGYQKTFATFE